MKVNSIGLTLLMEFILIINSVYSQKLELYGNKESQHHELDYTSAFIDATKYYLLGDIEQAISLYRECLKYKPTSAAVNFQLSQIYLKIGEIDLARSYGKSANKIDKDNKWYALGLATIYQIEQKYDSAIFVYEDIIRSKGENINIYLIISTLYARLKKYEKALEYLNKVEEKIGISKEVALGKFRIYRSTNKEHLAKEQLHIAHNLDDEDYTIIGMMAEYYSDISMPDSALFYYKMVNYGNKIDPSIAFSYNEFLIERNMLDSARNNLINIIKDKRIENEIKANYFYGIINNKTLFDMSKPILDTVITEYLGNNNNDIKNMSVYADVEFRLENYIKSAEILKKIIEKDNDNYFAWEQLLFSENLIGRSDSIVKYGAMAKELFENRPISYLLLGSAYYRLNKFNEASKNLEDGIIYCDNNEIKFEFYALLAECYVEIKNYAKSDYCFKEALAIDNYNINLRNNYAYYLAVRNERLKEAKELSKYTILKKPKNSTYLDTYAWIMYQSNRIRSAYKYISKAVKYAEEENSEILVHYGDILYKRGKYEKALKNWKRALELMEKENKDELRKKIANVKELLSK